jgi:hypothetical protein
MNTEKIKTLEQIHLAIELVEKARAVPELSTQQKYDLENASVKLWSLEQSIIRKKGDDLITSLTVDSTALKDLAEKIKPSSKALEVIAEVLDKAAKVVEMLIKIIVTAVASGLI